MTRREKLVIVPVVWLMIKFASLVVWIWEVVYG